jgi:hypothetical protein
MLSAWPGRSEALELAIDADPDFALAYAARSRMHLIYGEMPSAQEKAAVARKLVERNGSAREKSHVEILELTTVGQSVKALEMTLGHLENWPRDALILSLPLGAFGLFAFSGMADHDQARVDLCERHARHYDDDWWFLTYLGWSHTENGSVAMLAAMTGNRRALEARTADLDIRRASGRLPAGSVVPDICRAARAFAEQDFPACVRILEPVAAEVVRIGGSHAQREMIEDTLLIALMKSGEAAKARELLDRRLHRRPSLRDARWRTAV